MPFKCLVYIQFILFCQIVTIIITAIFCFLLQYTSEPKNIFSVSQLKLDLLLVMQHRINTNKIFQMSVISLTKNLFCVFVGAPHYNKKKVQSFVLNIISFNYKKYVSIILCYKYFVPLDFICVFLARAKQNFIIVKYRPGIARLFIFPTK